MLPQQPCWRWGLKLPWVSVLTAWLSDVGEGGGSLKSTPPPKTQRSSLKTQSETLCLAGLPTGPVVVGLAQDRVAFSGMGGGKKKISLMSWCWGVKWLCVGWGGFCAVGTGPRRDGKSLRVRRVSVAMP